MVPARPPRPRCCFARKATAFTLQLLVSLRHAFHRPRAQCLLELMRCFRAENRFISLLAFRFVANF